MLVRADWIFLLKAARRGKMRTKMQRSRLLLCVLSLSVFLLGQRSMVHAAATTSGSINPTTAPETWTNSTAAYIGYSGAGALTVDSGTDILSSDGHIACKKATTSSVTITGSGSTWINSGGLDVGESGTGSLNINNGGYVSSAGAFGSRVGNWGGSFGTVTVSGSGSKWTNTGEIEIGFWGSGSLQILNGGVVENTDAIIDSDTSATATVDGSGSKWTNSGTLSVGEFWGDGALSITNGGTVTASSSNIGSGFSSGVATVDGSGSTWNTSGNLNIHKGSLNITNHSAVTVGQTTFVGDSASRSGIINFGASGGTLTTGSLAASVSQLTGKGTINTRGLIWDGNLVFDSSSSLKRTITAGENVAIKLDMVSDPSNNGDLGAGHTGTGSLTIKNNTTVNSRSGYIAYASGSSGVATVTGSGSQWINSGDLYVGRGGNGTLDITDGATVRSVNGIIAYVSPNSVGVVNVTGSGSTWNNSGYLRVGAGGNGTLNISGGAAVNVAQTTFVGNSAGTGTIHFGDGGGTLTTGSLAASANQLTGTGTIIARGLFWDGNLVFDSSDSLKQTFTFNQTGQNVKINLDLASNPSANGDLGAGWKGSGSVTIKNGTVINSQNGYVGYATGSTGIVTVSGKNSTWNNSGLFVGCDGNGTLNIVSGGIVNTSSGNIGRSSMAYGATEASAIVNVSGTGSTWNCTSQLAVGMYGSSGTLNITDGGAVICNGTSGTPCYSALGGYNGSSGSEDAIAVATVSGVGSKWFNDGDLQIGYYEFQGVQGTRGVLNIAAGGTVTASYVSVLGASSLLNINVSQNGALVVGNGNGLLNNNGTIRISAGANTATGVYTPISATWGTGAGTLQALGGTWDANAHTFTVSAAVQGSSGEQITGIDLASTQRVVVSDSQGRTAGASFLASSSIIDFQATALSDSELVSLNSLLTAGESILSAWQFSTSYAIDSTHPVSLSLEVGAGYVQTDLDLWHYDGTTWTACTANDLTYDGTHLNFTVTGFSGYAVSGIAIPEPGSLVLLAIASLGVLGYVLQRQKQARQS